MKSKRKLKIKTIRKIGREISYFLPLMMGMYFLANFVSST